MYESEPHQEWHRLHDLYHAMSDIELLELAAKRDDLTQIANEVLSGEMTRRRIRWEKNVSTEVETFLPQNDADADGKLVRLNTFYDAIDAGNACRYLEERGVMFEVKDLWEPEVGIPALRGPAATLEFFVARADENYARSVLREKMGLFPLQEVAVADEPIDDRRIIALGYFGKRAEAEEVAGVLDDAHIWHRIVANPDGTEEDENSHMLEVKEFDLFRAGEVVERALNLPNE